MGVEIKYKHYIHYILIVVISLISLIFLPMLGSNVDAGFNFPTTAAGWLVYIVQQLITAIVNILIYINFTQQAEINVAENPFYLKAREIFATTKEKDYVPMTLQQFKRKEYSWKGVTIFLSSVLATFAFTQAVLTYDYIKLITYLFTVVFGVVFGYMQMKNWERFYITEYYDSALYYQKKITEEQMAKERHEEEVTELFAAVPQCEVSNLLPDTVADN